MMQPQRNAWRVFAAIGLVGGIAVGWGWGLIAGLIWLAVWGTLAGFTFAGKINPVVVLLFGHEWIRHGAARGLEATERSRGNIVVPTFCGLGARVGR